jgi:hypothetical protein
MESRGKFERRFLKVLQEDSTVASTVGGSEGGYNPHAGNINSKDSYAPGSAVIATPPAVIQTRKGAIKRKNKSKKLRKK